MVEKRRATIDLFTEAGADFDGPYRYDLFRIWNKKLPMILWAMLNPSTADEYKLDRTVARCKQLALSGALGAST